MAGALINEWNKDKMSEPPPVYNLIVFPGRRHSQARKQRNTDSFPCTVLECAHNTIQILSTVRSQICIHKNVVISISLYSKSQTFHTALRIQLCAPLYCPECFQERSARPFSVQVHVSPESTNGTGLHSPPFSSVFACLAPADVDL